MKCRINGCNSSGMQMYHGLCLNHHRLRSRSQSLDNSNDNSFIDGIITSSFFNDSNLDSSSNNDSFSGGGGDFSGGGSSGDW